jgi:hypothetical protein
MNSMASTLMTAAPSADEIAATLSFALCYEGKKRVHHADDAMARITADRLVRHLERPGFVLMKRPPAVAHSTGRAGRSERGRTQDAA